MTAQPTPAPASESDPYLADAVAHAEEGVAMLRRLARIGMEIAEDVRLQCKLADLHPEPRHDPRKGYDMVARSVRLTVALIRKMDDEIIAMRKGTVPVSPVSTAWRTDAVAVPAVWEVAVESAPPAATPSEDEKPDVERRECEAERLGEREFERFRRRLIGGEDFQALIEGDFAACADEIRAAMSLVPDEHPPSPNSEPPRPTPRDFDLGNSASPPCAPSVTAQERAPRHLPREGTGEEFTLTDP